MRTDSDLLAAVRSLDSQSYGAYKRLRGAYDYGDFTFHLDRIQSDPYAPPSACRVGLDLGQADLPPDFGVDWQPAVAALLAVARQGGGAGAPLACPDSLSPLPTGRDGATASASDADLEAWAARVVQGWVWVAVGDFLARAFQRECGATRGDLRIAGVGQNILARSCATVSDTGFELRFQLQLPARGRRILGRAAAEILDVTMPRVVDRACFFGGRTGPARRAELATHIRTYLDFRVLQLMVAARGWVSFLASGSVLARASGISDEPLPTAVPFIAPQAGEETLTLPYRGDVTGLAIRRGITVIAGGGYHGKSTLLAAIERGVWAHLPGDGRELVATVGDAVKVRAEDGRAVSGTDISLFISDLPGGVETSRFGTVNASGSTSQAAGIAEALECGVSTLLIDEDTAATNLLMRDDRMRDLVRVEPITPLIDRVVTFRAEGVSTVIVMGGCGDYLDVADTVLLMEDYRCLEVTARAWELAGVAAAGPGLGPIPPVDAARIRALVQPRFPLRQRFSDRTKVRSTGTRSALIDRSEIPLDALSGVVDPGQAEALAWGVYTVLSEYAQPGGELTLWECIDRLRAEVNAGGLDRLTDRPLPAFLAQVRAVDLAGAVSRFRGWNCA